MLQPHLTRNPLSCSACGFEVSPERVGLSAQVADDVARWRSFHDAFYTLWLDSGAFESWAREQLEDLNSPVNVRARELAKKISRFRKCYYWLFQDTGTEGFVPLLSCPRCAKELSSFGRWQACEDCAIVVAN
jgi:predicted  nucleic acid-binding Zn ribbon protein